MTDLDRTEDFLLDGLDIAYERELVTTEERDEVEHEIGLLFRRMRDRDSRVVNYNYKGKNKDLTELANL